MHASDPFADGSALAAELAAGLPRYVDAANLGEPRLDALQRLDDDLAPDGPRYADAAWAVPYVDGTSPRGATHLVVLCKRAPDAGADVYDHLLRHAESLSRAFDRLGLLGHPEHPVDFVPLVDDAPQAIAADAQPHPYVSMFRQPVLVASLLRDFILPAPGQAARPHPGLTTPPPADALDLDRLALVPEAWIPAEDRYADVVWSVPFRDDSRPDSGATHAVVVLKCEAEVRPDAGVRVERQIAAVRRALDEHAACGHPDRPAVVLPVVVYSGNVPWDAPGAVRTRPNGPPE